MDDYAKNGFFTGNAKFDPRLEEFKIKPVGPHTSAKQYPTFQEINRVFKEWAQGDWEVSGIDRSNKNVFDETLNKTLKNWKSTKITDQIYSGLPTIRATKEDQVVELRLHKSCVGFS